MRYLCCGSSLLVLLWFNVRRLFNHNEFPISSTVGALEELCFMTVAIPGYLHLYFGILSVFVSLLVLLV